MRIRALFFAAIFLISAPAWASDGFVPLFNGRDLEGWDGKPGWWRVEDGTITAESTPEKPCTKHNYLVWRGGEPGDFELQFEYRIVGGNSGVQFRSRQIEDWDMRGYQADLEAGPEWTGALFEHERGGVALRGQKVMIAADGTKQITQFAKPEDLQAKIRSDDWNQYRIVARGPEIQLFINGVKTAHAVDRQAGKAAARGRIGLQMHPGPPMKVQFRNLKLKEFAPGAAATPAEKLTALPGFKVELLYSPAKETEGSWVSMCADPKGRLYVSGQYDEGMFRVTPSPLGGDPLLTRVEKIPAELSSAQGLCWAFDSLYALVTQNAKTPSGLYRLRDTNGDDQLDKVETLRLLDGGGDHGWHAIIPGPDGKSLYAIAGNNTKAPTLAGSRVPPHWSEDHLLPRLPDASGFMKGVLAPGGAIYRVSPDGQDWEMIAMGFRNTYDAAFHRDGELFTYDADMEWDIGTPWYRPTRICLVASGAEFGWRNGAGKWPAHYPDSLPGVLDTGAGSPTGVEFGYNARFPARYREALYAADWTFGRIYAMHLAPAGASYRLESEVFVSGVPLPVVDMAVPETDGSMYFITGGWKIQTGLYRVTHGGPGSDPVPPPALTAELKARRELESFHGKRDSKAVDAAWPHLGSADRFLRYAARVAIEWQEAATWSDRALAETKPAAALQALLALVRVSARDEFHRKPSDAVPPPGLQSKVLRALARLDWTALSEAERLDLVRIYALCFTRLGPPSEADRAELIARAERWFPASSPALNGELCQLLVYLQAPSAARTALDLVKRAPTQEEQLSYIKSLRMLTNGWTGALRREYFSWFHRAAKYRGGASFAGFIAMVKADAAASLRPEEREEHKEILEAAPAQGEDFFSALAGRTNLTEWTLSALAPLAEKELRGRNFERGRTMFGAVACFQCHRIAGEGGAVGPDLTLAAGRFSARDVLESIIEPSKAISDLYGNVVIAKRDGEIVTGRIVYHLHEDAVNVNPDMFNPASTIRVDRKDILEIQPSPISPMPANLLAPLDQEEVLDLLAFVLSGGNASHAMFQLAGSAGNGIK